MRLKRNYYEVMGLPRGATAVEVKLRYHELARQYHPDRAQDKELAQRLFSQINLAYRTLANTTERARYDDSLDLEVSSVAHMAAARPAAGTSVAPKVNYAPPPPAPRPAPGVSRPIPTGPMAARPAPTVPLDSARQVRDNSGPQRVTIAQLLEQARGAYARGDRESAMATCRRILSAAPENFDALILTGDIHADSFRRTDAMNAYRRAQKAQPNDRSVAERIRNLQTATDASRSTTAPAPPKPQEKLNLFQRIIGGAR